jgi:hypothetical protein
VPLARLPGGRGGQAAGESHGARPHRGHREARRGTGGEIRASEEKESVASVGYGFRRLTRPGDVTAGASSAARKDGAVPVNGSIQGSGYANARRWATFAFAVASAVATCFAAVYSCSSWGEMEKQTRIQRNAAMNSERAWVFVSQIDWGFTAPDANGNRALTTTFSVRNAGKTPAKNVRMKAVVEIIKNGQTPTFSYDPATLNMANVLVAGDSKNFPAPLEPIILSAADWQELHDAKDYLVGYVQTTYDDVFGKSHWHHYCGWTVPTDKTVQVTARSCALYNDMDQAAIDRQ